MKKEIKDALRQEQGNQKYKWGEQHHSEEVWLTILAEEVGEVAKAILDNAGKPSKEAFKEIIQVAAVCISWLDTYEEERKGRA